MSEIREQKKSVALPHVGRVPLNVGDKKMTDNRIEKIEVLAENLTSTLRAMETIWMGLPPQENSTELNQIFALLGVCIEKSKEIEKAIEGLNR